MATMKEVAALAGVSTASVSYVINGTKKLLPETEQKVREAIRELGYQPLHGAGRKAFPLKAVGVLVEDVRCFPTPDILCGVAEALENYGHQLLMYDLHLYEKLYNQYELIGAYREQVNQGVNLLLEARVSGVIYVAMHDRHLDGLINKADRPLVYAYSLGSAQDSFVTYANKESTADTVRYLIGKGHRRIALISGHPHSFPAMKRLNGFQIAMQEAGLTIRDGYLAFGDWEYESGYARMKEMLALPERPTAVIAMNDFMAAGCLHALYDSGIKVPEEVAVVGFDNREACQFLRPRLTTVDLPVRDIGRRAAHMLMDLVNTPDAQPRNEILPCKLIERGSA